jgi:hypothetical protein
VNLVRAHVHLERKNWPAAADAATRFISRQPDTRTRVSFAAAAYAQLGRRPAAAADFTSRARRSTAARSLHRAREGARGPGRDALEQALRSLDEGIARLGRSSRSNSKRSTSKQRLNRYDAALARLGRHHRLERSAKTLAGSAPRRMLERAATARRGPRRAIARRSIRSPANRNGFNRHARRRRSRAGLPRRSPERLDRKRSR